MGIDEADPHEGEQIALAKRLRFAREYLGLLQEDVAKVLDIPRASVSAIESGKRRVSSLELSRLGRLYRRPASWLLGEEGTEFIANTTLYRATKELSDQDREQVLRFAEFLAGAGRPGTAQPGTTQPGTTQPGTAQPRTTHPKTTQTGESK